MINNKFEELFIIFYFIFHFNDLEPFKNYFAESDKAKQRKIILEKCLNFLIEHELPPPGNMLNIYCELMNLKNYPYATNLTYKLKFANLTKDSYLLFVCDSIISGTKY